MIVLDPGHGGGETNGKSTAYGARGPLGTTEADVTLDAAVRVRHLVDGVTLTRTGRDNPSLAERIGAAGDARAFVSIHADPTPDQHANAVWVHTRAPDASLRLAHTLAARLGHETAIRHGTLAVLDPDRHRPGTAACLVQLDCLADAERERRLRDEGIDRWAVPLAEGVRACAAYGAAPAWPRITVAGHAADAWALVRVASPGLAARDGMLSVVRLAVRKLVPGDVDFATGRLVAEWLAGFERNGGSVSPFHTNAAGLLPSYKQGVKLGKIDLSRLPPYIEYLVRGGRSLRFVVDVKEGLVFLSWHYGDGDLKGGPAGTSPHVIVDRAFAPEAHDKLVADAREWWAAATKPIGDEYGSSRRAQTYACANDIINSTCPRCSASTDRHRIPFVRSTEATETLARKVQGFLDAVALRGSELGLAPLAGVTMVGAAIATIGSERRTYVSVSGAPGAAMLGHIASLGKDVTVVDVANAAAAGRLLNIQGALFTPTVRTIGNGKDYPLGACAAQKLLNRVIADSVAAKKAIGTVEMSEIFWRAPGGGSTRVWSTGEVVESCDTCKQVLAQMMCTAEI